MPSSSTRVTLPNLGTLELAVDPSILQFIEVPAVQVLQFEDIRLSTALQHLKPRTLPLTSFSAIGCSSLGDETLPLPDTLTALELSWPSFDVNAILEKLTEGQCPNITYLNLSCSNAHSSSIIRLVKGTGRQFHKAPPRMKVKLMRRLTLPRTDIRMLGISTCLEIPQTIRRLSTKSRVGSLEDRSRGARRNTRIATTKSRKSRRSREGNKSSRSRHACTRSS
jgi:hypothetical protein